MILVDLDVPEDVTAADLDALVARWGQSIRHAVADGAPSVNVGAARGHALALTSDNILAALALAREVIGT